MEDPENAIGCHCQCGAPSVYVLRADVGSARDTLISAPCSLHVARSIQAHVITADSPWAVKVYKAVS